MRSAVQTPAEIRAQLWVAWGAVAAVLVATTWADPDLGGHLRYGTDILRDWSLPTIDPYSFTQDRPWVNHEWLSEAIMAAAYNMLGTPGLVLLKGILAGLTLLLVRHAFRHAGAAFEIGILTLSLLCTLSVTFTVRPQLWSLLALAALVTLVARPSAPGWGRIALTGLLFAAWANLHGGWIVGAGLLVVYATARGWRCPGDRGRLSILTAVALLGTLLNPYGFHQWTLLATTVRLSRPEITEWQPLGLETGLLHWLPIASIATLWAATIWKSRPRPPIEVTLTLFVLLAVAIRALRIGPLVTPAALLLLAPYVVAIVGSRGRIIVGDRNAARMMWLPALVVVLAVVQPVATRGQCLAMRGPWVPDLTAAASLKETSGRMWTTFGWGQYSNWQFGPALRVSIDGRLEVYSDAVRELHRDFEAGREDARQTFLRMDPDVVWLPSRYSGIKEWLTTKGYRIDLDTGASFVAVKKDRPPLSRDRPALPHCFQ